MRVVTSVLLATLLFSGVVYADKPDHAGKKEKRKSWDKEEDEYREYQEYKVKKEKGNKKHKSEKHSKKKEKYSKKNFSSKDKGYVHKYYRTLPPGLAKKLKRRGELPVGWQRKVNVGEPIPYDYLRYAKPVSHELELQLSAGPVGSKVLQLADRVIRIETGTNMVLDAIKF